MSVGQLLCAQEQSECRALTQVCGGQSLSQARLLALLIISGGGLDCICVHYNGSTIFLSSWFEWFQWFSGPRSLIFQSLLLSSLSPVCRATSNNKVKDMVLLELSYVNSNLQLLMGQLEGLNSSVDVYQNTQWVHMLLLHLFSQLIVLLPHSSSNMVSAYMCRACLWLVFIRLSNMQTAP